MPLVSAPQLAWGARYRPSPSTGHVTIRLPLNRWLARRTWMCLPGLPGPGTAIAEVSSTATAMEQQIWRGIHEGAHLDHLSSLARLRRPMAPSPGEFGAGLLVAESYAMAVELLAGVECILAGEGHAVWQLGAGLIERATRLPGGANPAAEFADLPTLAEVYLLGPLDVLSGGHASAVLPAELTTVPARTGGGPPARPTRPPPRSRPALPNSSPGPIRSYKRDPSWVGGLTPCQCRPVSGPPSRLPSQVGDAPRYTGAGKLYLRKSCIDRHGLSSYTKLIHGAHGIRDGQRPGWAVRGG